MTDHKQAEPPAGSPPSDSPTLSADPDRELEL